MKNVKESIKQYWREINHREPHWKDKDVLQPSPLMEFVGAMLGLVVIVTIVGFVLALIGTAFDRGLKAAGESEFLRQSPTEMIADVELRYDEIRKDIVDAKRRKTHGQ